MILLLGLDRFHFVNDGMGTQAGDKLLMEVAHRLTEVVRSSDTVSRFGGDRFALILQISNLDDGNIVARKVLERLNKPFTIQGQQITVGVSIGASLFPNDGEDPDRLLEFAERAMHHAKREGGNRHTYFANEMNERAINRLDLERRMRTAIEKEGFRLYYQPKVDAETNKLVGAEALIRWIDSEKGFISPGTFIPMAEENGLIIPIGNWVLRESCRQNKVWQDKGLNPITVSINVSARQFNMPNFVDIVRGALEHSGLDPKYLELEITEGMLVSDVQIVINRLNTLRELGCPIAIDDFGTGYSSLGYLTQFPVTTLKIDKSFIQGLEHNVTKEEVARAIIGLSRGLKLEVVAEGAENSFHVDFLRTHGCNTVQGFYFSRPLPADEFEKALEVGFLEGQDTE